MCLWSGLGLPDSTHPYGTVKALSNFPFAFQQLFLFCFVLFCFSRLSVASEPVLELALVDQVGLTEFAASRLKA